MVNHFFNFYKKHRAISNIAFFGIILRLVFILFFADKYFMRESIFFDADTAGWLQGLYNLNYFGEFTILPKFEFGSYSRMPGYTLFLAPAYYLVRFFDWFFGLNLVWGKPTLNEAWISVLKLTAFFQFILDIVNIYLVYFISIKLTENKKVALLAALLYCSYPFIIVWNPVCYSELSSVFFALLAIYMLLYKEGTFGVALAGLFMGFSVLCRPQFALLAPLLVILIYSCYCAFNKAFFRKALIYTMFFGITYGAWPLRNYLRFNKIILTQDLRGYDNWNDDVLGFMQYIYSVKSEWQPQFDQILHNEKVDFPKESYLTVQDSLKLEKAVALAKTCGRGFSEWKGYWKETIMWDDSLNDCSQEIAKLFYELRQNQVKHNPYNFYVKVPLQNLKKALFKFGLLNSVNLTRKLGGYLFFYRSLLIILGLVGLVLMLMGKKEKHAAIWIGVFFISLYFYLCFGTSPQCRNIEMRYFLQADILLLIPAAYFLEKLSIVKLFLTKLGKDD
jgi:hypothetical protein